MIIMIIFNITPTGNPNLGAILTFSSQGLTSSLTPHVPLCSKALVPRTLIGLV